MGVVANVRRGRGGRVILAATASALALMVGSIALPQAAAAQTAQSQIDVDIPAQDLNAALLTLTQRAGLQIAYEADKVAGRRSSAVQGRFTPTEALSQMLVGTGLTFRVTGGNRVSLEIAPQSADSAIQLGPVRVEGEGGSGVGYPVPPTSTLSLPPEYHGGQVARGGRLGMLGNVDVMDAPFNITNYTSKLIEDQNASTIQDVLKNEPSVRRTQAVGGGNSGSFIIRGFGVNTNSSTIDGLSGLMPNWGEVPTEFVERVEVLKGPSALLKPPASTPSGSSARPASIPLARSRPP